MNTESTNEHFHRGAINLICELVNQDAIEQLQVMGLDHTLIDEVRSLTLAETLALAHGQSVLKVEIDKGALARRIDQVKAEAERNEFAKECVYRGAPFDMMQAFFSMTKRRYEHLKRYRMAEIKCGTPPALSDEHDARLYEIVFDREDDLTAHDVLAASDELGLDVRCTWRGIQQVYRKYGGNQMASAG